MKKRIKKLWLEALRGKGYRQGRGRLRAGDGGFCCLAVLCDLHAQATGEEWRDDHGRLSYLGHPFDLPLQVQEWAGL